MKDFVINLLKEKIPEYYYYHNYEHTLYVAGKVLEIGDHEHCTKSEMDLLRAAALWHDTGYINTWKNHEKESCALARQYLPGYGYSTAEINAVCGMIMATRLPQSPQNKLERIIADADLEYLGTAGAETMAENLYKELQHQGPSITRTQWLKKQISFLQMHRYFTGFCKEKKEPEKKIYLQHLMNKCIK